MTSVNDANLTDDEPKVKTELEIKQEKAKKRFEWINDARKTLVFGLSMATGYALIALIPVDNEAHKVAFVAVGGSLPGLSLYLLAHRLDKWRLAAHKKYITLKLSAPKEESTPEDQ